MYHHNQWDHMCRTTHRDGYCPSDPISLSNFLFNHWNPRSVDWPLLNRHRICDSTIDEQCFIRYLALLSVKITGVNVLEPTTGGSVLFRYFCSFLSVMRIKLTWLTRELKVICYINTAYKMLMYISTAQQRINVNKNI
jgi:hypothetical protein